MQNFSEEITGFSDSSLKYVIDTKTVDDILEEQYITNSYIVENFLNNGVYIFAGAPKVGKSFFMLQLAYSVSKGIPFMNRNVNQSDVLYLALEDTYIRLQKRIATMFGTEDNSRLHIAVNAGSIPENNLITQLENFITMHRRTRLIIIDTLQKIRETSSDYSYSKDYSDISELKKFADDYGICLVIVHHTRKMDDNDKFIMISGTNGLMGSADGAFVMYKKNRIENQAVIEISSRDITDEKITVKRNTENLCWELIETTAEHKITELDEIVKIVGCFINAENPKWEGTPSELVNDLNLTGQVTPCHLTRTLNINVNELYDSYNICYAYRRTQGRRIVKLLLNNSDGK